MADKGDEITLTETLDKNTSVGSGGGADELNEFVHNILKSTQNQFDTMSNKILSRLDDVNRRVDELEKQITDLMNQAGIQPDDN